MNARVAVVLLVLLAALGGGALLMYQQERDRAPAGAALLGLPVLRDLRVADIAVIAISEPGASLTLQRRDSGWAIAERTNHPADPAKVREFLLGLLALKIGQVESMPEKDRARFGLDGSGTKLELRDGAGSVLASLVAGKKYFKREPASADDAPADGRFVLAPWTPGNAIVVADPLALVTAASAPWVSKTGFGAEKVRVLEVDFPAGGKWRIERAREDASWKLTPLFAGESLDALRANSASYSLNRIELADVGAPGLRPEQTGLDRPVTVVASTFDGLTYTIKLGKARGEDDYATLWISGEPRPAGPDAAERAKQLAERLPQEKALAGQVLLLPRSKFEDVLRKRAQLLVKKDPAKK